MLSVSFKKKYVYIFLLLIKKVGDREYIKELTHFSQFLFIYNSMTDIKSHFGHAFHKFVFGQIVVLLFWMHSLNFWIAKKLNAKFEYTFWLISIYLVQPTEKTEISTLFKRGCSLDK